MSEKIIAYKGFDKDLKCRGFQYEIGKEYEMDGEVEVRKMGFHACAAPLDVFNDYAPYDSRYCIVEQSGELSFDDYDGKIASSKIKIGAEIKLSELVKAHVERVKSKSNTVCADDKVATAGDCGMAIAGKCGVATAGDCGMAIACKCGVATAGYRGTAIVGNCGAVTAGDCGMAIAGKYGAATSKGSVSVGVNGCGLVRGEGVKARGGMGTILTICVEDECGDIAEWKSFVVDGETVKADTWYTLKDGEIVEVEQ